NYVISRKETIVGVITQQDIEDRTIYETIIFLEKLFTFESPIVQEDIYDFMNVTVVPIPGGNTYKITLGTRSPDETINNSQEPLESVEFSLHARDIPITRTANVPTDITLVDIQNPDTLKSKEFLSKLFDLGPLTQQEIDSLLIVNLETITPGVDYRVSLSPNGDVTINGQSNEFVSDQFSI
ncbi:MAG: hypothetical protein ACRDCH_02705, partial [Metamycoplasmataceae bacterium]